MDQNELTANLEIKSAAELESDPAITQVRQLVAILERGPCWL
jgi:hypothetical protein